MLRILQQTKTSLSILGSTFTLLVNPWVVSSANVAKICLALWTYHMRTCGLSLPVIWTARTFLQFSFLPKSFERCYFFLLLSLPVTAAVARLSFTADVADLFYDFAVVTVPFMAKCAVNLISVE